MTLNRYALLLVVMSAGCATTRGEDAELTELEELEQVVAERATPWIRVEAGAGVTRKQKLDVMKRVGRAFDYALEAHGWTHPEALCEQNLVVKVRRQSGAQSVAEAKSDTELFVGISPSGASLDRLLAHEVTHVQDLRVLKKATRASIPRYLYEGKALALGNRYRMAAQDRAGEAARAQWLSKMSADDALVTLKGFRRTGAGVKDKQAYAQHQSVGVFFVEFLRTRVAGQRGDVIPMLARVFEKVGAGGDFDAAFVDELGVPLQTAEESFLTFLKQTQDAPDERLRGTIYAGLAAGK